MYQLLVKQTAIILLQFNEKNSKDQINLPQGQVFNLTLVYKYAYGVLLVKLKQTSWTSIFTYFLTIAV